MRSRVGLLLAGLLLAVGLGGLDASAQGNPQVVLYQPPVGDGVVDPFRPPAHIGASGNRGLEYGNPFGRWVHAAADGVVTFAGQVAGRGVVTIEHADGVRTTYTGLGDIWVSKHERVTQGSTLGTASEGLHFGARILDHYLDPQILVDASGESAVPRLVPAPDNG